MASIFEYKEVVGIANDSVEAAIQAGLNEVSVKFQIAWFEAVSVRGRMVDADTTEYQVTLKIGCREK